MRRKNIGDISLSPIDKAHTSLASSFATDASNLSLNESSMSVQSPVLFPKNNARSRESPIRSSWTSPSKQEDDLDKANYEGCRQTAVSPKVGEFQYCRKLVDEAALLEEYGLVLSPKDKFTMALDAHKVLHSDHAGKKDRFGDNEDDDDLSDDNDDDDDDDDDDNDDDYGYGYDDDDYVNSSHQSSVSFSSRDTCITCVSSESAEANSYAFANVDKANKKYQKAIEQKAKAFNVAKHSNFICPRKTCQNDNTCVRHCTPAMRDFIAEKFWGQYDDKNPCLRTERREALYKYLESSYKRSCAKFEFKIDLQFVGLNSKPFEICETALLRIAGYDKTPNFWYKLKRRVQRHKGIPETFPRRRKLRSGVDALAYILEYKTHGKCDRPSATQDASTKEAIYVLPFAKPSEFYRDYVFARLHKAIVAGQASHDDVANWNKKYELDTNTAKMSVIYARSLHLASMSTFKQALLRHHDVRFQRCKGSFPSCNSCISSSEMLNQNRRWTSAEREAIFAWRRKHLDQQEDERANQALRVNDAKKLDPRDNQPMSLYIMPDGMTEHTTQTPHLGTRRDRKSKEDANNPHKIQARIMGFHVVCGLFEGFALHTNLMV